MGKDFVLENFTQERQVSRTEDLYFKLLAEKTGRVVRRDERHADPIASGEAATVLTA
jgi:hypothetical protein